MDEQRRRERQARVVLDHMYQFVGLLDPQGNLLDANQTALDGAGIRRKDITGKPFEHARWWQVSPEIRRRLRTAIEEAAAGAFVRYDVQVYGAASGSDQITIDFNLIPVFGSDGTVEYLIAEGRNITEQKLAEAEVARQTTELQRVYERIRELDALKTEFFANVSHELRTPLALILGPVERLLENPAVADAYRIDLEVVRRNARTVLKHVNDLLDISKLEAGRMTAEYGDVDLAVLVRRSASHFDAVAKDRGIAYDVQVPDTLPAQLDADKIERVLLNLLSNALKFTPDGGTVRLILATRGGSYTSRRAIVTVQDSGPGIATGQREAVFERFRQVEGGANRRHRGTGLGLAIVKDFVELHSGTVSVGEAALGGASFVVELPLQAPAGVDVLPPESTDTNLLHAVLDELATDNAAVPAPSTSTGRPLVLVVEDNPDMNRFVAQIVAREYDVAVAYDGAEGLEAALRLRPALILSDVMMPGTDGASLLAAVRQRPEFDGTPFVFLTAKADEELAVRLLRKGAQDHIAKPFSPAVLLARISLHVRTSAGTHAAGASLLLAPDGSVLRAGPEVAALTGKPNAELLSGSVFDLLGQQDRAALENYLANLRASTPAGAPAPLHLEVQVGGADDRDENGDKHLLFMATPIFDATASLRSVACHFEDISERHRERASHVGLAMRAADMGMWTWDIPSGRVTWSGESERLLGVPTDGTNGYADFLAAVHPDDREKVLATIENCLSTGAPLEMEYRVVRPDGTVVWALSRGQVRRAADGTPVRMSGVLMDVTRRHQAEEERSELLNRDLRAAERATRLQLSTAALSAASTTERVVEVITAKIRDSLDAEMSVVVVADREEAEGLQVSGAGGQADAFGKLWRDENVVGRPPLQHLPWLSEPMFLTTEERASRPWQACAVLPLSSPSGVRATWVLGWKGPREFPEEERTFLSTLAGQCAQALSRAALHQRDHNIATALQRTLLPSQLPDIRGTRMEALYLPGGRDVEVGGDWYDVIPLGPDRVGVVIGDVEGHSVGAAAVMGQVRNALRAYAVEGHSPSGVMQRLNQLLTTLHINSLATCCYLEFSSHGGTATMVLAGHPPPLLLHDDGTRHFVDVEPNLMLGVDDDATYAEKTVLLPPGATLLLYTDGLVEASDLPVTDGLQRLYSATESCVTESRLELDSLLRATLGERDVGDDVALLSLTYCPDAEHRQYSVSRRLPCDPTSASAARCFVSDVLEQWNEEELTESVTLMVSELVTNAVLHTTAHLELCLELRDTHLRVAVRDRSERLPAVRDPSEEETGGRGLLIIGALAEAWGIDAEAIGKSVWFTVAREPAFA